LLTEGDFAGNGIEREKWMYCSDDF